MKQDTRHRESFTELRKKDLTPSRHEAKAINDKKINFRSDLTLCGRRKEIQTLTSFYQSLATCTTPQADGIRLALVSGQSGAGKTSLVRTTYEKQNGMFVSGKFDQLSSSRPFPALVNALDQLCQLLATSKDQDIAVDLTKVLGRTSLEDLVIFLPQSKCLVREVGSPNPSSKAGREVTEDPIMHSLDRVKTIFRSFLECVSKRFTAPLVIFIDDLQWSDIGSLQLLETLLTSKLIRQTLIVASYRHDELPEIVQAFLDKQHSWKIPSTAIQLDSLTQPAIEQIIMNLTDRRESTSVSQLAGTILAKTGGNSLYVLEFIRTLEARQLIKYSLQTFQFEWDIIQIKTDMNATMNIVDLIAIRMEQIPTSKVKAIIISSFLGSTFSVDTLASILCSDDSYTLEELHDALDYAQKEGLLESVGSEACPRYKFIHDRLQHSAYKMVQESEKASLHWHVGWALFTGNAVSETEQFLAMEHLNTAVHLGAPNSFGAVKLAELNREAAIKAKVKYAFVPAAMYLQAAIHLLASESPWDQHYDLILDVMKLSVEVHIALGCFEDAYKLIDTALVHMTSLYDAFPLHMEKVKSLAGEGRQIDSFHVGLRALSELGVRIPNQLSKARLVLKIISVRRKLKRMSNGSIMQLPDMVDERSLLILNGMTRVMTPLFHLGNDELLTFVCLKQIEVQLQQGLASSFCFAVFGYICIVLNEVDDAYRFGKLSQLIQDRCRCDTSLGSYYLCNSHLHSLKNPMHECIDPLWSAYNLGFRSGIDPHAASFSAIGYADFAFHCGLYLPDIFDTLSQMTSVLNVYRQFAMEVLANVRRQRLCNFIDKNHYNVMVLDGIAMNETALMASGSVDPRLRQCIAIDKLIISVYFTRAWPQATQDVFTTSISEWKMCGFYLPHVSFIGLASLRLAKSCFQRRKNLSQARSVMKDHENSSKKGNVNTHVLWLLLDAEYRAVTKQRASPDIKQAFDKAISVARRSGLINIAGLGNTLAAEFFQESGIDLWKDYANEAVKLYREWGASALVKDVERKFKLRTHGNIPDNLSSWDENEMGSRSLHQGSDFVEAHQGRNLTSTILSTS